MSLPPFSLAEIEERLDDMFVEAPDALIEHLTQFDILTQDRLLELIQKAVSTNNGLAYQLCLRMQRATELMELDTIELWLDQAIDVFDSKGLYAAIEKLDQLDAMAERAQDKLTGIAFEEVCLMLEHFVTGLNGRGLKIELAEHSYTDTEQIYLPGMLNYFSEKEDNFQFYKCMVVHLWAQNWFGSWQQDIASILQSYNNPQHATQWLHKLESLRLDYKIQQELPGIHRQMQRLSRLAQLPLISELKFKGFETKLDRHSSLQHSLQLLAEVYPLPLAQATLFDGLYFPEQVESVRQARLIREKGLFRTALAQLVEETKPQQPQQTEQRGEFYSPRIEAQAISDPDMPQGFRYQLLLDGQAQLLPEGVESLISSIIQDLGQIPDDYLVPAGEGQYVFSTEQQKTDSRNVWAGTYHEEGAFLHKEWDYRRQRYKKNWCALREVDIAAGSTHFVEQTLSKYSGLIKNLRRTFEILRGEDRMLKRQPYGDDIDIDALVEGWADAASGMEMPQSIFTKMHKEERNIAVIFMVDMSGSTKGWINTAERESLVLLCEALQTLGDRYAIYGFTGNTRKRCEVYPVKTFEQHYDAQTQGRIANITPQDYTRLGVFIRHFNQMFESVEAKTKLLITLSDGKPEDYDGYRGEYGIEDTRMALLESRQQGIHPFCITIDREGRDYLKTMYGQASYVVIDDIQQLPVKVADIYRHITS